MDEIEEARDDAEVKTLDSSGEESLSACLSHHQTTKNKGEGERVSERARQGRAGIWLSLGGRRRVV